MNSKKTLKSRISTGSFHIIIERRGILYRGGANNFGQLGTEDTMTSSLLIYLRNGIRKEKRVSKLCCGKGCCSFIKTNSGKLLGTGCGDTGVFGDGEKVNRYKFEEIVFYNNKKVVTFFVGYDCLWVIVLDKNNRNRIFRSGYTGYGQLGNGDESDLVVPIELKLDFLKEKDEKIIFIVGYLHTFLLSNKNRVYGCGKNDYWQLGGVKGALYIYKFQLIDSFCGKEIIDIDCGKNHSLFVDSTGDVMSCGDNSEYGQCGHNKEETIEVPTRINGLKNVVKAQAGECHSLFLTKESLVFGCGENSRNQLGMETGKISVFVPTLIDFGGVKIISIHCMDSTSFFVTSEGKIVTVGGNRYDQCLIAHSDTDTIKKKTEVNFQLEMEFNVETLKYTSRLTDIVILTFDDW